MAITQVSTSVLKDGAVTSAKLDTNIAIDGNLTVDTDTLYVDSANNRVGIGTTSPSERLEISSVMSTSPTSNIFLSAGGNNALGGGGSLIFGTSATAGTPELYNAKISGVRSSSGDGSSDLLFATTYVSTSTSPITRLTIKDTGNVGIGTNSPVRDLQVKKANSGGQVRAEIFNTSNTANSHGVVSIYSGGSSAGDAFLHWKIEGVQDWSIGIDNSDSDKLKISKNFGPGTNDYLTIDTSGIVGIGTTSPSAKLHISGGDILANQSVAKISLGAVSSTGDAHFGASGIGTPTVGSQDYGFYSAHNAYRTSNGSWKHSRAATIHAVRLLGSGGGSSGNQGFSFDYSPNVGTADITWSNLMQILPSGNVGIGTDSPVSKLTLEGARNTNTLTLRSTSNDSSWAVGDKIGAIDFYSNDASGAGAGVKASISYENTSSSGATNHLSFRTAGTTPGTNNTERMRIDSSGNTTFTSTSPELTIKSSNGAVASGTSIGKLAWFTSDPTTPTGAGNVTTMETKSTTSNGSDYAFIINKREGSGGGSCYMNLGGNSDGSISFGTNTSGAGAERMRITSGGSVTANVDMRAPIFYDSDNTGYYLDPTAGANSKSLMVNGFVGWSNQQWTWSRDAHQDPTNSIKIWDQYSSIGGSGSPTTYGTILHITGRASHEDDQLIFTSDGKILHRNAFYGSDNWSSWNSVATSRHSFTNNVDLRAPIFYDSDNTAYYVNPQSLSNMGSIRLDETISSSSSGDARIGRNYAYHTLELKGYGSEMMIGAGTSTMHINYRYCNNTASTSQTPQNWYWRAGTSTSFSDHYWGIGYGVSSLRAPIFYDYDDTSFYVDPNSTSRLNKIQTSTSGATPRWDTAFYVVQGQHWYGDSASQTMYLGESDNDVLLRGQMVIGGSSVTAGYALTVPGSINMSASEINYVSQLHFADNISFYDEGNDNYLNFKYGDAAAGGIVFRNGSGSLKGYLYADNAGFGLLDNDGAWAVRTQTGTSPLSLYCDSNEEFQVHTSYTLSLGSSRAPIFYDSNNTAYYVDPAGQSRMGNIERNTHSTGFLVGSYNSVGANSAKSNPIYTIGNNYNPTDTSIAGMYGIGYAHPNLWGSGKTTSWGLYVAEAGIYNCTIGAGSTTIWAQNDIVAYSDKRVKDNIEIIPNAVEKVKQLNGVTFTRTDANEEDKNKRHTGVIAQDVLKVLPEAVVGSEEDLYSVAYGNMVGLLIEAIKEQQTQIDELKQLINKQ